MAEFEWDIIRERTKAGLESARARGKIGGRPPALPHSDLAAVRVLLHKFNITVEEAIRRVGIYPSTLYRYLPSGRSALVEKT